MLSGYSHKQNTHLVIDTTNNGVLTLASNTAIANAICFRTINAEVMSVKLQDFTEDLRLLSKAEFDKSANFILTKIGHNLIPQSTANLGEIVRTTDKARKYGLASMDTVSKEWINRRKNVHKLKYSIYKINGQTERIASYGKQFFGDTIFLPFIKKELDKCNPSLNEYTDAIHEWSSILSIDVKEGFELLLKETTNNLNIIRKTRISWGKRCL